MAGIRGVARAFSFIAGGLAAILVGLFMIRGTMHLWDDHKDEE